MWLRVLGSAAGGGYPQWNCGCPACRAVREGSRPCRPRTQSSIAVSADYQRWFLLNASPDIRAQIESFPALRSRGTRSTPLQAVLLTDAELDHTLGLLLLREGRALELHATPAVHETLCDGTALLRTLGAYCPVEWRPVALNVDVSLADGVSYRAFEVPTTKRTRLGTGKEEGRVVGYRLTDERSGRAAVYLPGVQELTPAVREQLDDCACLLFDGTCWHDDELIRLGLAGRTAREMGHLPIEGPGGSSSSCHRFPSSGGSTSTSTTPIRSCWTTRRNGASSRRAAWKCPWTGWRCRSRAVMTLPDTDSFVAALRAQAQRYHDRHPFHVEMNEGRLSRWQIQGWVANRFYYQENIPRKDAAILANCPDREVRRRWIRRVLDHDGTEGDEGGTEAWLRLGEAVGLTREEVCDKRHVVPGVRFAVDAYVTFARTRPWAEAVASSLTELFAPDLMTERIAAFERSYPWIDREGLTYFRARLRQAPRDSEHALEVVTGHCRSVDEQERAVAALSFKCDVLWSMLDAIDRAYAE
ncbi:pyrroloquinoline-quinone synthase PqqC [Allosalinactinospora lopnorensis]|uniref:pyrroloquinoline-quinone synthase PqqC n=1 Tax=Allosalinactinospora lopnorensis TaxID=1352348 RepID=UPI000A99EBFA|nr:pyrroloquinoline-quinone synthase PqqC [Allosalinactinospora lopnorensis]